MSEIQIQQHEEIINTDDYGDNLNNIDSINNFVDYRKEYNNITANQDLSLKGKLVKVKQLKEKIDYDEKYQRDMGIINEATRSGIDDLLLGLGDKPKEFKFIDNYSSLLSKSSSNIKRNNEFKEKIVNIENNKNKLLSLNEKLSKNEKITKDDYKDIYEFILADNSDFMTPEQLDLILKYFKNNNKERKEFIEFGSVYEEGFTGSILDELKFFDFKEDLGDLLIKSNNDLSSEEIDFLKAQLEEQINEQEKISHNFDRTKFLKDFIGKIEKNSKFNGENFKNFILEANALLGNTHKYELLQDNRLYNLGVNIPKEKNTTQVILENQEVLLENIDTKINELEEEFKTNSSDEIQTEIDAFKRLRENLVEFISVKTNQEKLETLDDEDFSEMAYLVNQGKSSEDILKEKDYGNKNGNSSDNKIGQNIDENEVFSRDYSNINFSSSVIYAPSYGNGGDFFEEFFRNFDREKEGETKILSYNDGFKVNISKDGDGYSVKYGDKVESCDKEEVKNVVDMGRYMNQIGLGFLFGGINRVIYRIKEKGNGKINEIDGLNYDEKILGLKSIGEALIPGFDSTKTEIKDLQEQFNPEIFNMKIQEARSDRNNKFNTQLQKIQGGFSSLSSLASHLYPGDRKGEFNIDKFIENI